MTAKECVQTSEGIMRNTQRCYHNTVHTVWFGNPSSSYGAIMSENIREPNLKWIGATREDFVLWGYFVGRIWT